MSNEMKLRWVIVAMIVALIGIAVYQATKPSDGLTCVSNCEHFKEMRESLNEKRY